MYNPTNFESVMSFHIGCIYHEISLTSSAEWVVGFYENSDFFADKAFFELKLQFVVKVLQPLRTFFNHLP